MSSRDEEKLQNSRRRNLRCLLRRFIHHALWRVKSCKRMQDFFYFILRFSFKTPAIYSCFSSYFSANGQPTIIPRNDTKNMGQRVMMTKTDIEKVRRLYHCGTCFFLWVKITVTQLSTFNFNLKSDHITLETQTGKAACGRTLIDAFALSMWLIADQIRFGPLSYVIFFFFKPDTDLIYIVLFYFTES